MSKEWPEYLMIRNTGIVHEEEGGIIFTTTGRGYTKHKYVNSDEYDRLLNDALTVETTLKKQIKELADRLEIADPDGETIDMV